MLCRRAADRYTEAGTYINLGDCQDRAGDRVHAQRAWRRARTILDELGNDAATQLRRQLQARPARAVRQRVSTPAHLRFR